MKIGLNQNHNYCSKSSHSIPEPQPARLPNWLPFQKAPAFMGLYNVWALENWYAAITFLFSIILLPAKSKIKHSTSIKRYYGCRRFHSKPIRVDLAIEWPALLENFLQSVPLHLSNLSVKGDSLVIISCKSNREKGASKINGRLSRIISIANEAGCSMLLLLGSSLS